MCFFACQQGPHRLPLPPRPPGQHSAEYRLFLFGSFFLFARFPGILEPELQGVSGAVCQWCKHQGCAKTRARTIMTGGKPFSKNTLCRKPLQENSCSMGVRK